MAGDHVDPLQRTTATTAAWTPRSACRGSDPGAPVARAPFVRLTQQVDEPLHPMQALSPAGYLGGRPCIARKCAAPSGPCGSCCCRTLALDSKAAARIRLGRRPWRRELHFLQAQRNAVSTRSTRTRTRTRTRTLSAPACSSAARTRDVPHAGRSRGALDLRLPGSHAHSLAGEWSCSPLQQPAWWPPT